MKKSLEQRTEEESYDSVISIESSKVPFRLIRNFYYSLFPKWKKEKAYSIRNRLTKKYNLNEEDIKVYSYPSSTFRIPHP